MTTTSLPPAPVDVLSLLAAARCLGIDIGRRWTDDDVLPPAGAIPLLLAVLQGRLDVAFSAHLAQVHTDGGSREREAMLAAAMHAQGAGVADGHCTLPYLAVLVDRLRVIEQWLVEGVPADSLASDAGTLVCAAIELADLAHADEVDHDALRELAGVLTRCAADLFDYRPPVTDPVAA